MSKKIVESFENSYNFRISIKTCPNHNAIKENYREEKLPKNILSSNQRAEESKKKKCF